MVKTGFILAALLISATIGSCVLIAEKTGSPKSAATPRYVDPWKDWTWTTKKWMGNDKPYQKIRSDIDKAITEGQDPNALRETYKIAAQEKPDDPQAQFGWGYAAWESLKKSHNYSEESHNFYGVPEALAQAAFPDTYNYARLRFLAEAWRNRTSRLKGTGELLLRHDPDDYDVKYQQVGILELTLTPSEEQKALAYVQELIQAKPGKPNPYSVLGGIHMDAYDKYHHIEDGQQAVAAFQEYMRLAPPDDDFSQDAARMIPVIQRQMAEQQAKTN